MTSEDLVGSIEDQVLGGGSQDLRRLAAKGLVPLAPEQLIPLQVKLAADADSEVASLAAEALLAVDPRVAAPVLAHGPDADLLGYFAVHAEHPLILETIVRHRSVPHAVLLDLAARLPGEVQEVLILRQDAILAEPAILDALETNPDLRRSVRRRLREYREHLLPREPVPADSAAPDSEPPTGDYDATPEEVEQAIEAALLEPAVGDFDQESGLSEGQIRTLSVPVRLQLSRGAGKTLRDILIRDSNPLVASSVLQYNTFSDAEVERVARMRTVVEEVLETIGRSRRWMRKYPIALALVRNPRTPIPIAVGLVPRMAVRDLRILRLDRNISDAVRTRANRLYHQKVK